MRNTVTTKRFRTLASTCGLVGGLCAAALSADPLPEGPGLAARFPGDRGIAEHPDVIFATDFTQGIVPPMGAQRRGVSIIKDPDIALSGGAAAKIVATQGEDTGGDIRITWPEGLDEAYVRVYVRFDKDTVMPTHFVRVAGTSPSTRGGGSGQRVTGGQKGTFRTTLEPPKQPDGYWQFYAYWHEMRSWQTHQGRPDGKRPKPYYGNIFGYPKQTPPLERDQWICIEIMVKVNTIGGHDGEMAFWIDGVNYGHWCPGSPIGRWMNEKFYTRGRYFEGYANPVPFEGFSWRTHESLKINHVLLQWYLAGKSYKASDVKEHIVYFDNLVIAKSYIGPLDGSREP